MGDWPILDATRCADDDQGSNQSATVTAGSANTKGAWTQLFASTPFDADGLFFTLEWGTGNSYLVDIGIGAAGSEQVLVPNILIQQVAANTYGCDHVLFPIVVTGGTRMAIRCQSSTGLATCFPKLGLYKGGWPSLPRFSRATDYGTNTSTTQGTAITPSGTANTKGAWAQLVASTTNPIRRLLLSVGDNGSNARNVSWWIDLGIGAAGSEQVLVPNMQGTMLQGPSSFLGLSPMLWELPCFIPSGTRLAARCAVNSTNTIAFQVSLVGLD